MRAPLFGTSHKGRAKVDSAQRRVNVWAEPKDSPDRDSLVWYGRSGLTLFANLGLQPIRGMREVGSLLFVVAGSIFYEVNNAGTATNRGNLSTSSGRVSMTDDGTYVSIADGAGGYTYHTGTNTFATISDGQFSGGDTCAFMAGRTLWNVLNSGQFQGSEALNPTSYLGTDVATAEADPDDLVAVHVHQGRVVLFGAQTTEFWANVDLGPDFPFLRIQDAVVPWGLHARWSVAEWNGTVAFLAYGGGGEAQVRTLDGARLSTPEVEAEWGAYSDTADASALSYMDAGHPIYQINFPTQGVSWGYDGLTGLWSELEAGTAGGRHRGEIGARFLRRYVVSDFEDGRLYELDPSMHADNGEPFARELISRHVFDETRRSVGRVWADFETGVGKAGGQGEDPQAMLQISRDGGHTYGPERWTTIGKQGKYRSRAIWRRLGSGYEVNFRLRVSDPVQFALAGAWVDAS